MNEQDGYIIDQAYAIMRWLTAGKHVSGTTQLAFGSLRVLGRARGLLSGIGQREAPSDTDWHNWRIIDDKRIGRLKNTTVNNVR